ncbi:MAG TPA: LysM peptidoglycan-binding domain-containing protein [Anaerolineae bacterium]
MVRFGDTLNSIARRFGVSVWTLASVNGIRNINFIFAGQVLRIPCGATPPPTAAGWYRVRAGDTVSSIAARFGESVFEIINANGLHFPYTIFVGQWLRIP